MRLVVSNIAWTNEEEADVARLLQALGVKYIELAPTKTWQDPTTATDSELNAYKKFWADHGIEIVAFQSMLFNRPDLKIFDAEITRNETFDYLQKFIRLAPTFGVGVMVFGSPKNRQRGDMPKEMAEKIAQDFFDRLGDAARANNTCLCIEPNAAVYACDFIVTAQEGIDFVRSVSNSGIGLHLDTACMSLAGDDISASIKNAGALLRHFHISSPMLDQVGPRNDVDHQAAAAALEAIGYQGFVSIEMRPGEIHTNLERVRSAVTFAQSVYNVSSL